MKVHLFRKGIAAFAASLLVCASGIFVPVFARENIELQRESSLTVYFGEDGNGFSDVEFLLYRVADLSEAGVYTLSGDFQTYPVNLNSLDSSDWRALAQTLAAYAARDGLQPMQSEKTAKDGYAVFPGLAVGLYLVIGDLYVNGEAVYWPEPMLVSLPGLTEEDEWNYHVRASCKFDSDTSPTESVRRKVLKIWKDDGNEERRPEKISVQLLKDGTVADTVILSQENNWEYTWENLDGSSKWQVVEAETPEGYTVSVAQEGITFVITNTGPSDTPLPPSKLPQTGMLWWPVPLLVSGGLLFVIIGLFVQRRCGDENEK